MPGHYGMKKKDKGMKKYPGGGEKMMGYGDGGMHHNPHGFGVENGGNSNFTNPPKGHSKETK